MKGCLTLAFLIIVSVALADSLDDQYIQIFNLIQQADAQLQDRPADALANYVAAQTALQRLKSGSPDWNSAVVDFRLSYVARRIAALSGKVQAPEPTTIAAKTNSAAALPQNLPPPNWEAQLAALQEQVRQLQGERIILEAKLKEAFAVLPAESDPRELARAQEQVKSLQKENELLKLSVQKANASAANAPGNSPADKTSTLPPQPNPLNPEASAKSTPPLEQTKSPKLDSKELSALRAENELLKKKVASLEKAAPTGGAGSASSRQLAQAQAEIAALQSDKDLLRMQLTALEGRMKQTSAPNPLAASAAPGEDSARITQLERERDELRKQLATAQAEATNAVARAASPAPDGSRAKRVERERDKLQEQLTLTRKELANASRAAEAAAAQNSQRIAQLESERDNLQKQLTLAGRENSNLLHSAASPAAGSPEAARIEALEREKRDLQIQLALANELASAPHPSAQNTSAPDQNRIKQFEQERDELQKQFEAARKELQAASVHTAPAQPDLQVQLAALGAPAKVIGIPPDALPPAKPLPAPEVASQAVKSSANPATSKPDSTDKAGSADQGSSAPPESTPRKTTVSEERLKKLSAQIEALLAAQKAQQQQVADLAQELKTTLEKMARPSTNAPTQQDLKLLANATRELDQARLHDEEQIRLELADLGKTLTESPSPAEAASPVSTSTATTDSPASPLAQTEYVIQAGDTLLAISHTCREKNINVTVDQILNANPGLQPTRLRVGQKIIIPAPAH